MASAVDSTIDSVTTSEEGDYIVHRFRNKEFRLNKKTARERMDGKRVINGLRTAELNVLPLKYPEAYRIYKQMKANHWEPDVIDMTRDCTQWNSGALNPKERWIIEMGVGYFSAAEGIVGDSILHVIEDNLTAAELKHATLRQIAEESIHMDSLLHIIGSLKIDVDEVTAKFNDIPSVKKKNAFITRQMPELKRGVDLTTTENKQKFAKAIVRDHSGHGGHAVLRVVRDDPFVASPEQNDRHRPDVSIHVARRIESHRAGTLHFRTTDCRESGHLDARSFRQELVEFMREGVALEKEFVSDCLPEDTIGMTQKEFLDYVDFNADRRLAGSRTPTLSNIKSNPFNWLDEVIFLKKEKNFLKPASPSTRPVVR